MQITGLLIVALSGAAVAEAISPVMKVVELLEDCKGKIEKDLAAEAAAKNKELYDATEVRKAANAEFSAAEAELVKSVDECGRAVVALEKGMALLQGGKRKEAKKQLKAVTMALTSIVGAVSIETESSRKLKSFLQQTNTEADNDDLSLKQ